MVKASYNQIYKTLKPLGEYIKLETVKHKTHIYFVSLNLTYDLNACMLHFFVNEQKHSLHMQ